MIRLEYDKEADAAYVYLVRHIKRGEAKRNVKANENIILDFNDKGKLLGVEILNARKILKKKLLQGPFKFAASDIWRVTGGVFVGRHC